MDNLKLNELEEIESQLKNAFLENKKLSAENKHLLQALRDSQETVRRLQSSNDQLLQNQPKMISKKNLQSFIIDLTRDEMLELKSSQTPVISTLENTNLHQDHNDQELQDVSKFFKDYFQMMESLFDQLPWDIIKECFKSINKLYKGLFNGFQELGDINLELQQLEAQNKTLLNTCKESGEYKYKKQYQENRKRIEQYRKEQTHKEQFLQSNKNELQYMQDQFKYMCSVEDRRFKEQLRQEKQLLTARERIQSLQQQVDYKDDQEYVKRPSPEKDKENRDGNKKSKKLITFQATQGDDQMLRMKTLEDQTQMWKNIQMTRQKLSHQIQNALYQ